MSPAAESSGKAGRNHLIVRRRHRTKVAVTRPAVRPACREAGPTVRSQLKGQSGGPPRAQIEARKGCDYPTIKRSVVFVVDIFVT